MKIKNSFFSILFFLPLLLLNFATSPAPTQMKGTVMTEDADAQYRIAVIMDYKDADGNFQVMLPEEYSKDIPKAYNQLVLAANGKFYNEQDEPEVDFESLVKLTGLDQLTKNLGGVYHGMKISSAHYIVYEIASFAACRGDNRISMFYDFYYKCFGLGSSTPLPDNCQNGYKTCSCTDAANINQYPCKYCWRDPAFSIQCDSVN